MGCVLAAISITADQRHTLVFNGEVYNFKQLRVELEAKGHAFQTAGDTEVVLQAIAQWGDDALKKLAGMFAFAAWDAEKKSLFCARDHLGDDGMRRESFIGGYGRRHSEGRPILHNGWTDEPNSHNRRADRCKLGRCEFSREISGNEPGFVCLGDGPWRS